MTSSQSGAARICGEQDCNERTNRPNHPLCYAHYIAFQADVIGECPNHPGVYKPSEYDICRSCFSQRRQPAQSTRTNISQQPQDNSRGWNRPPTTESVTVLPSRSIEAVERVRRNLGRRESVNHESNTIQFLIMPLLGGLGWDESDPEQVIREYKPAGKQRFRQSIAVDIALLEKGIPKVFIEAKRLDREHTSEYDEQLAKYASHLEEGTAALTNGRYWQIFAVSGGNPAFQRTIDVAEGDAESAARELHRVIGRDTICKGGGNAATNAPPQRRKRQDPPVRKPNSNEVRLNLLRYRRDCYQETMRRGGRAFYIVNDETVERIVAQRPANLRQLESIQGISPSTLRRHGDAIIRIVHGEG